MYKNSKFNDYDEDDYGPKQHPKKKKEKKSFDGFEAPTVNKKCKQCALKNECSQSNPQKCKRFTKNRFGDNSDY